MEMVYFSTKLRRIFDNPGSLTRRQGAEFASRLYNFVNQKREASSPTVGTFLWTRVQDSEHTNEQDVPVSELCPQAQFMWIFEQILRLGLDRMRRNLLINCEKVQQEGDAWQMLAENLLEPMARLTTFSRVMAACMSPLRSWLAASVLMGYRTLCLADQIRKYCLEHFLAQVASPVTISLFKAAHYNSESCSNLLGMREYINILKDYHRFQIYLSRCGFRSSVYDQWKATSDDAESTVHGNTDLFSLDGAFVVPYLDSLRQFYRPLLQDFDATVVAFNITDWLMQEKVLAAECGITGFHDAVVNCLLQEAVRSHLDSFGDVVKQKLEQEDYQGLGLFFRIIVMVDGGLEHTLDIVRNFVKNRMLQMFSSIKAEFESLDPNSSKATGVYIDGCLSELRSFKAMVDSTELSPPLSKNLLLGSVKTGVADVLNSNALVDAIRHPGSYPAVALAHHFHRQMRATRALDADSKELITDLMTLYSLLLDKEAFLVRYHCLLRERLLSDVCDHLSLDAEDFALQSFTQMSGWKAVYEVKSVLKDYKESEEFNASLANVPEYQQVQQQLFGHNVPLKFTFVRGYFWRMTTERVRLPASLEPLVSSAVRAYESNHTGRVVSFACSYGSGLLAFSPDRSQDQQQDTAEFEILLRCSTAILILLLNFNDSDSLTQEALLERTGIRCNELTFYLHHLVRAGLLIEQTDDGKAFVVNNKFRSNAKLVNLMVLPQQQAQKHKRRLEKQDQRMKEKRLQCAIVAVMKHSGRLARRDLMQLVTSRLLNLPLRPEFFAEQLVYLISGGYIRVTHADDEEIEESVLEYIP